MTIPIAGERIVVTGATGYVGSFLVPRLNATNEVHVLVRDRAAAQHRLELLPDQVHSASSASEVVEAIAPTVLFHLATHYERTDDVSKMGAMVDANVRFGSSVLEAASRQPGCEVVVAGSHFQFGGPSGGPASLYAATKDALCVIARYLQQSRGLRWIQPVLFDVYGPRDERAKFVNIAIDRLRKGLPIQLPDPEPLHHFVYIDDVVDALIVAAYELRSDPAASGGDVFVTSSGLLKPSAVLAEIAHVVGAEPVVASERFELPPHSIMVPVDGVRPKGWQPSVTLRTGLERILEGSTPS